MHKIPGDDNKFCLLNLAHKETEADWGDRTGLGDIIASVVKDSPEIIQIWPGDAS